jgi:phage shock protein A
MAMFRRFWAMLKSNLNHLIGKAEDPEKMLNQMLIDMQEQLITAKQQVAVAIADEKRLLAQLEQEKSAVGTWESRAMQAVNAGSDDLARQALERQADHQKQATGFEQQWQGQKQSVEKLKVALQKLTEKIDDAKRRKNLLVARAKRAQAEKTITETMGGMTNASAFDTMDRMEEKIGQMEAEAQATSELALETGSDSLEEKFKKLDTRNTDDALSALKSKMGKTPGLLEGSKSVQPSHGGSTLVQIEREAEVK